MAERSPSVRVLASVALLGAIVQLIATILLGFAPAAALQRAASEGADAYLLLVAALTVGGWTVWRLRHRWMLTSLVAVAWPAAVYWPLHDRLSGIGLVLHGESFLHHFLAVLSGVLILIVTGHFWRVTGKAQPLRWVFAVGVAVAVPTLLLAHVEPLAPAALDLPRETARFGGATMLGLWPLALLLLWRWGPRSPRRLVATALLVPPLMRLATAGWAGLTGEPTPGHATPWVMTSIIIVATVTFVLFRPSVGRSTRLFSVVVSAVATSLLYVLYRQRFGDIEDSLAGLHQSLFGFAVPYPPYLEPWQIVATMLAIFFMLAAICGGVLSDEDRGIGLGLGLLAVSGIGFTTPQLVLMASAGFLLIIDTMLGAPAPIHSSPPQPLAEVLSVTAKALGLRAPVVLEQSDGQLSAIRGDLEGISVEVRVRSYPSGLDSVLVQVGVRGRGRPDFELEPRRHPGSGERPSHHLRGPTRTAERLPDALWQALADFPRAHAKFWLTGTEVTLGSALANLDADHLVRFVRALRRTAD